jgi:hypothetical protein
MTQKRKTQYASKYAPGKYMIDGVIVYDQWLFVVVSHKIPFCKNFGASYPLGAYEAFKILS